MRAVLMVACLVGAWAGYSADARACNTTTVCFEWITEFTDSSELGEVDREDYLIDEHVRARGAKVEIIRPAPEDIIMTNLNHDGCVTFVTQSGSGHRAKVYTDSVIEGVRLRAGWGDYNVTSPDTSRPQYPDYHVEVDLQDLQAGGELTVPLTNNTDWPNYTYRAEVAPLYAAAVAIMSRVADLGLIPGGAAGSTLAVAHLPASQGARCNCDADDEDPVDIIDVGVGGQYKKFMLAHEIGHWVHVQHRGGPFANFDVGNYGYPFPAFNPASYTGDPEDPKLTNGMAFNAPCAFTSDSLFDNGSMLPTLSHLHGLRSAEHGSAAHLEGYAHFVSAVVHNNVASEEGWYRYYKSLNPELPGDPFGDLIDGEYMVELGEAPTVGGERQWIINQCPDDRDFDLEDQFVDDDRADDDRKDDVGVELDWFRFWWRFATAQPGDPPGLVNIARFVGEATWEVRQAWPEFEDRIANPGNVLHEHETRFVDLADQEGVQNGL